MNKKILLKYLNEADYAKVLSLIREDESFEPTPKSSSLFMNLEHAMNQGITPSPMMHQGLELFINDFTGENMQNTIEYNIPPKPTFFLGRKKELKEIHKKLTKNNSKLLLLHGIGGMGKTTLMQEYLYKKKCLDFFTSIVFISVNKNLENAFIFGVAQATKTDLMSFPSQEEKLYKIKEVLKNRKENTLIVIDNINEPDKDDLIAMKSHFEETQCHFLITTRTIPDDFEYIEVTELDTKDALLLFTYHYAPRQIERKQKTLLKYVQEQNVEAAIQSLLKHILKHTLLIELTAKAGQKKGLSVDSTFKILENFDSKHGDLQRIITLPNHAKTTYREQLTDTTLHNYILNLFETDYLENAQEGSEDFEKAQVLRYFSVLPSIDISVEDLKLIYAISKTKENEFENRLDDLRQMGWLQGKQELIKSIETFQNWYYKMHPLVKEVVFEKLKPTIDKVRELVITVHQLLAVHSNESKKYQEFTESLIKTLEDLHGKAKKGE